MSQKVASMKVSLEWDDKLRVRIGQVMDSYSHGPGYGGTGAIRLRQVLDTWFFAYRLDDHASRGTAALQDGDFDIIKAHLPSAQKAAHHHLRRRPARFVLDAHRYAYFMPDVAPT
jgi:hypothetical protein